MKLLLFLFSFSVLFAISSCHKARPVSDQSSMANNMLYNNKWYLAVLDNKPYTFEGMNNQSSWLLFTMEIP